MFQQRGEPVILTNPFVVPAGSEEDAIAMWAQARDFLATQPGYISTKLHRSLSPDALIDVAEWESMETFQETTTAMRQSASIPRIGGVQGYPQ